MIDYHQTLVTALNTVLPTHYEMATQKSKTLPCISYMELSNVVDVIIEPLAYNRITYQVKIWGNKIGDLQKYAQLVDDVLRPLGWKRVSCNEAYDPNSTMIQKIMSYENLIKEEF